MQMVSPGRDDWIRTSDPLHPIQVRYRTAPHPEAIAVFNRVANVKAFL